MRLPILLSLSLLLTLPDAWAQPADEFFHGGAQFYLSNNIPAAKEAVTNGLKLHPEDVKLKKLYELLNQQQQQQNQEDQKNEEQNEKDQQDQQKKDEQKQQKNDQQKKDEQKKQQEQDKKDQPQAKPGDKSQDKPDEKKAAGETQPVAAHAMTPQEAQQLLDAQKGDEQVLQFVPQGEPKNRTKQLKDW